MRVISVPVSGELNKWNLLPIRSARSFIPANRNGLPCLCLPLRNRCLGIVADTQREGAFNRSSVKIANWDRPLQGVDNVDTMSLSSLRIISDHAIPIMMAGE